ncbi:hypothetical protein J2S45_001301 [Trueperella abortisuis]|uniref:Uncharacterized protein n=1 Tax=Trueperella abortisuis TaxID=445930 RepID=A0ABT9PJJ3_9ACTO|nr:hypothetical protein [Trueperella abortisuis]
MSKKLLSAGPKPGSSVCLRIVKNLGVHQPGIVIDRVMKVGIPARMATRTRVLPPLETHDDTMPTTVRDTTELFDISMHQLSRERFLIPVRHTPPHGQPGYLVEVVE